MVHAESGSLRLSRSEKERLIVALVLSLCVHLAIWGSIEIGKKYGWWSRLHTPVWMHKVTKKLLPPPAPPEVEPAPTVFVDVAEPDATPPKKTMYYSDKNSQAANTDADSNSNKPKLNGKQEDYPKTEDTPRPTKGQPAEAQARPLQPSPEKPTTEPADSSSPMNLGDEKLKQLASKSTTQQQPPPQPEPRPRTLKQVMEQEHLPGLETRQEGAARHRLHSSFDVKATPFGDYDRAIIDAVTAHWYSMLDKQNFALDRTGQVVIKFKLQDDGTVEDVQILQNNVGTLLSYVCQASIEDSAPFGKWPDDMRREIGANFREITFTFDYY